MTVFHCICTASAATASAKRVKRAEDALGMARHRCACASSESLSEGSDEGGSSCTWARHFVCSVCAAKKHCCSVPFCKSRSHTIQLTTGCPWKLVRYWSASCLLTNHCSAGWWCSCGAKTASSASCTRCSSSSTLELCGGSSRAEGGEEEEDIIIIMQGEGSSKEGRTCSNINMFGLGPSSILSCFLWSLFFRLVADRRHEKTFSLPRKIVAPRLPVARIIVFMRSQRANIYSNKNTFLTMGNEATALPL